MLQLGKSITSANDPLRTISVEDLYKMITCPSPELSSKLHQLRILSTIDFKKYQEMKKMLPYITCGIFSPPYRRTQNFGSISQFIVDVDHLSEKEINITLLKEKFTRDDRVEMVFVSPGGDGLKVLFRLSEKCYDPAKYSMFYKLFIKQFSQQYQISQVVDKVTSDVARACFLSIDEQAYLNNNPAPVNMAAYINFENESEINEANRLIRELEKETAEKKQETEEKEKNELSPDLLEEIKRKLNPNIRLKPEKQLYVPEEIDKILPSITERTAEFGIQMKSAEPINFGKKFRFELDTKWAQLNVFYGKQGYKVVKTPVTGSDSELSDIVFRILCEMFY